MAGDEQSTPEPSEAVTKPKAKTFSCTNCGAPVTVRYPGLSLSAVCESCHSIIDTSNPNYEILVKHFARTKGHQPRIALGSRGKLFDKQWEVIGFMVRSDVKSGYSWEEYLLFNPYYGYRFLVYDHGHWNFVRMIKERPDVHSAFRGTGSYEMAEYNAQSYRLYNRGDAQVDYVLGEFYWRVIAGSRVQMTDYIHPPEMLSSEFDDKGRVWSLATYVEPGVVGSAFTVIAQEPRVGVAPNQISRATETWKKMSILWGLFTIVLICLELWHATTAMNQVVAQQLINYVPNTKTSDITIPVFNVPKAKGNVRIDFRADVDNSWVWAAGEMVNNTTGASFPFERTCEYYHGVDSDGAWSEGSSRNDVILASVPGGDYYINLDLESGQYKDTNQRVFSVSVMRDIPTYANFFWCLFFLSLFPSFSWVLARQDEVSRWSNSDFSPYQRSIGIT